MSLSLSDCDITLSPAVRRRIGIRYKEQMKKWAPKLVESDAAPMNKALCAMLTSIWEPKIKSKSKKKPSIRRSKGRNGGYGVYDLRVLKLLGEWTRLEELEKLSRWRVTACYSDVIRAKDANEAARIYRQFYPVLESDWLSLSVDKEAPL